MRSFATAGAADSAPCASKRQRGYIWSGRRRAALIVHSGSGQGVDLADAQFAVVESST